MQISAANLLASQSQSVRSPGPAAAFEPIAFKQTPQSAVAPSAASKPDTTGAGNSPAGISSAAAPRAATAYVRPGSQIDIKI